MAIEHLNDEELLQELAALAGELHAAPGHERHLITLINVIDACVRRGLWESRVSLVITSGYRYETSPQIKAAMARLSAQVNGDAELDRRSVPPSAKEG